MVVRCLYPTDRNPLRGAIRREVCTRRNSSDFDDVQRCTIIAEERHEKLWKDELYPNGGDEPFIDVYEKPTWLPLLSQVYRVLDAENPGTSKQPNVVTKFIPTLEVLQPTADGHLRKVKRSKFVQLSPLVPMIDNCLRKRDKHENDILSLIGGTMRCNLYQEDPDVPGKWDYLEGHGDTFEQQWGEPPADQCKSHARNYADSNNLDPNTIEGRFEPNHAYKDFIKFRARVDPKDYGVTFNPDTGVCNFTRQYCNRFGLEHRKSGDHNPRINDCYMVAGSGLAELLLGTTITRGVLMAGLTADYQLGLTEDRLYAQCGQGSATDGHRFGSCMGYGAIAGFRTAYKAPLAGVQKAARPIEDSVNETVRLTTEYVQDCTVKYYEGDMDEDRAEDCARKFGQIHLELATGATAVLSAPYNFTVGAASQSLVNFGIPSDLRIKSPRTRPTHTAMSTRMAPP